MSAGLAACTSLLACTAVLGIDDAHRVKPEPDASALLPNAPIVEPLPASDNQSSECKRTSLDEACTGGVRTFNRFYGETRVVPTNDGLFAENRATKTAEHCTLSFDQGTLMCASPVGVPMSAVSGYRFVFGSDVLFQSTSDTNNSVVRCGDVALRRARPFRRALSPSPCAVPPISSCTG